MQTAHTLALELGTEELPPRNLRNLGTALAQNLTLALKRLGLDYTGCQSYASPRRLGLVVTGLVARQPPQILERRGPALSAAFDAHGQPRPAATGFARSCGVSVPELERLETPQGSWLVHRRSSPGQTTLALLPEIIRTSYAELPVAKRMRWHDGTHEFIRPVHWLLALYGSEIIPLDLYGVTAGRQTYGHRFHHPAALELASADAYPEVLNKTGHVVADFNARQAYILEQVSTQATELGGIPLYDTELLDEITALVEWPVVVAGRFSPEYLALPSEVLIAVMQGHQRYFPLQDTQGHLLPAFITVSNIQSRNPAIVQAGNERVIKPRLADAAFFWQQDQRQPLQARIERLKTIIYQSRLGTLHAKAARLAMLGDTLAQLLGLDPVLAQRAAWLAKTDLTTDLVGEFPELQGTLGKYYARLAGEPEAVAIALEEQYYPRGGGAQLPQSGQGQILALADKLDTLVGAFGIGIKPSGDKDPYGLRRAAIGLLRISIEQRLDLDLVQLCTVAQQAYAGVFTPSPALTETITGFLQERFRVYFQERGLRGDVIACVLAQAAVRPYDASLRLGAVDGFARRPEARLLISAYKRMHNLLRQTALPTQAQHPVVRMEPAEQALAGAYALRQASVQHALQAQDYDQALSLLAELAQPLDTFFVEVMVMVEDPQLRASRLALLHMIYQTFSQVADFSHAYTVTQ